VGLYRGVKQLASVSERRLSLHRRLERQQKEAEALKAELARVGPFVSAGQITYMIAHEINNLLTPLKAYAKLALQQPEDRKLAEKTLRKTVENAERASEILQSMVALAEGREGRREHKRVRELVEEALSSLCRDLSKDGISVEVNVEPELTVWAEPAQMRQVLMNLILNAREAMLNGGGVLTIQGQEQADSVVLEVSDTGRGMTAEQLSRVFEPLYSSRSATGVEQGGTGAGSGVGLAFCRRVIESYGGSIGVESKPGYGTRFTIRLPRKRADEQ